MVLSAFQFHIIKTKPCILLVLKYKLLFTTHNHLVLNLGPVSSFRMGFNMLSSNERSSVWYGMRKHVGKQVFYFLFFLSMGLSLTDH